MYIAGVAFERKTLSQDKYKNVGKIWHDEINHRASILFHGIKLGHLFAKPFKTVEDPPYLKGDLMIQTGEYQQGEEIKKEYMWCGWIWTESNQHGCIYQIVLEVNPMPVMVARSVQDVQKHPETLRTGVFLPIHLEDKEDRVITPAPVETIVKALEQHPNDIAEEVLSEEELAEIDATDGFSDPMLDKLPF